MHQACLYVYAEEAKALPTRDDGSRRAQSDAEYFDGTLRPMFNLIRAWCCEASADTHDEIRKLRSDVARFETLFAGAVALLVDSGQEAAAWEMHRNAPRHFSGFRVQVPGVYQLGSKDKGPAR